MNTYEINKKWNDINDKINILQTLNLNEDIELSEEYKRELENELKFFAQNTPIEIIKNIKNKEGEISARKEEIKRLQELNKNAENVINFNRQILTDYMIQTNTPNIQTTIGTITLKDGMYKVEILNENEVPEEYLRYKTEVNKSELQKVFKNAMQEDGELLQIPGVKYVKGEKTISIK